MRLAREDEIVKAEWGTIVEQVDRAFSTKLSALALQSKFFVDAHALFEWRGPCLIELFRLLGAALLSLVELERASKLEAEAVQNLNDFAAKNTPEIVENLTLILALSGFEPLSGPQKTWGIPPV